VIDTAHKEAIDLSGPESLIEVISPNQNIQDVLDKAIKLIGTGIKTVWTLEPYSRTIFVTTMNSPNQLLHNQLVEAAQPER
jgi:Uma2 family endonuclease